MVSIYNRNGTSTKFRTESYALLGKIFLPFTILKGLFDFFSSASEEYQDSGSIINAITAGIGGAIGGFFGILLDLPKNIISWLFEVFLGEGNIISTTLDLILVHRCNQKHC